MDAVHGTMAPLIAGPQTVVAGWLSEVADFEHKLVVLARHPWSCAEQSGEADEDTRAPASSVRVGLQRQADGDRLPMDPTTHEPGDVKPDDSQADA